MPGAACHRDPVPRPQFTKNPCYRRNSTSHRTAGGNSTLHHFGRDPGGSAAGNAADCREAKSPGFGFGRIPVAVPGRCRGNADWRLVGGVVGGATGIRTEGKQKREAPVSPNDLSGSASGEAALNQPARAAQRRDQAPHQRSSASSRTKPDHPPGRRHPAYSAAMADIPRLASSRPQLVQPGLGWRANSSR